MSNTVIYHALIAGLSGTVGALVGTAIVFPLERLTALRQTRKHSGFSECWHALFREGVYKGLHTTLVAQLISAYMFFASHKAFKTAYSLCFARTTTFTDFLAATTAALVTAISSNPVWLVNNRVMVPKFAHKDTRKSSALYIIRDIYDKEGFSGFFRGVLSAQGTVLGTGLQFCSYEFMKRKLLMSSISALPTRQYLYIGMLSKVIATLLTYPAETLNRRIQSNNAKQRQGGPN